MSSLNIQISPLFARAVSNKDIIRIILYKPNKILLSTLPELLTNISHGKSSSSWQRYAFAPDGSKMFGKLTSEEANNIGANPKFLFARLLVGAQLSVIDFINMLDWMSEKRDVKIYVIGCLKEINLIRPSKIIRKLVESKSVTSTKEFIRKHTGTLRQYVNLVLGILIKDESLLTAYEKDYETVKRILK